MINKDMRNELNSLSVHELLDYVQKELIDQAQALSLQLEAVNCVPCQAAISAYITVLRANLAEETQVLRILRSDMAEQGLSEREWQRIVMRLSNLLIKHQKELKLFEPITEMLRDMGQSELEVEVELNLSNRIDVFHHYLSDRIDHK